MRIQFEIKNFNQKIKSQTEDIKSIYKKIESHKYSFILFCFIFKLGVMM